MSLTVLLAFGLALPPLVDDGDDRYQFIAGLADKGMHELVVDEAQAFLRAFEQHPKAELARYRLGIALFELERFEEAEPQFASLAGDADFEYVQEARFRLGQCGLERGQLEAAATAFQAVATGDAEYLVAPAWFLRGEALFRQDELAQAESAYEQSLAKEADGQYASDAWHALAWCAFRQRAHDKAIERARRFVERWPSDGRVGEMLFLAGESRFEAGDPREALAVYERVDGGPFHDAALRGAGFAAAALDDHARAARYFGRVVELYPDSRYAGEAALHRGIQLLKAGEPAQAVDALRAPAAGEGPEVRYWTGLALTELERDEEALQAFDSALDLEPDEDLRARLLARRGDVLYDLGRTEEAARNFEAAGSDYALHAAAVTKLNDGDAEEAARLSRALLAREDAGYRAEAQLTLAEALFALEHYDEAGEAFSELYASEMGPEVRARALSRLGWCAYLAGDTATAAERFGGVVREFSASAEAEEALFMLGRASEASGAAQAAARAYRDYLGRFAAGGRAAEASLRLARLEPGEAGLARLRGLLASTPDSSFAPEAHFDLAERLSAADECAEAVEHYAAVLESAAGAGWGPSARYGLAWCQSQLGEHARAAELLRGLARDAELDVEMRIAALELLVWTERQAGAADRARQAFQALATLCDDEPRRLEAARVAAGALRDAGEVTEAAGLFEGLLDSTRDRGVAVQICIERAYLALELDQPQDAERQLRIAHEYVPDDPQLAEAFFFVGESYFVAGEDEQCQAVYALAASAAPAEIVQRALYKSGFSCLRTGDLDGAARAFATLVADHPGSQLHGESLFLLAEARFRAGKYEESLQPLKKVRRDFPRHEVMPKVLFRLGVALARTEKTADAVDVLAELAREYPDFPNATEAELWRGRALAAEGQTRGARQAFKRVIERDRGILAAQAGIGLGRLALAAGERDVALSEFLKVAVLYAHDEEVAEALYMAGQVLEAMGDTDRAVEQYREIGEKHSQARFAIHASRRLRELNP